MGCGIYCKDSLIKMSGQRIYADYSPSRYFGNWNSCDGDLDDVNEGFDTNSESTWVDSEFGGSSDPSQCRGHLPQSIPNFLDIWRYSMYGDYVNSGVSGSGSLTQVFLKETLEQVLDTEAKKIQDEAIIRIQKCSRMFLARRKFLRYKSSLHCLQGAIRRHAAR